MVSFMSKPQPQQQGQGMPPMMKALLKMPGVGEGVSQIFAIIQAVNMQLQQQNEMLKVLLTVAAEQRDAIAALEKKFSEGIKIGGCVAEEEGNG